jgi:hypothetical protein
MRFEIPPRVAGVGSLGRLAEAVDRRADEFFAPELPSALG